MGAETSPSKKQTTSNPPQTTTPPLVAPKTHDHCTQYPGECLTLVNGMSKAECAAALAKSAYVQALQDALEAELARVIRSEFDPNYSTATPFRPSMRCGSLVMEAVVGDTFASQLREHYSSGGNELKLEIKGQPVLFVPQPV